MNSEDIVFLMILLLQGCRTFNTSLMSYTVSTQEEIMFVLNLKIKERGFNLFALLMLCNAAIAYIILATCLQQTGMMVCWKLLHISLFTFKLLLPKPGMSNVCVSPPHASSRCLKP